MKRNHIRQVLFLLPVLLMAGCWGEIDEQQDRGGSGSPTTFTATIGDGAATKTLLDGQPGGVRPVWWSANDTVSIGGAIYRVSAITSTDPTEAKFSGSGAAKVGGKYKAYYPKDIYNGGTLTLPAEQKYGDTVMLAGKVYPKIAHLPMYAESDSTKLRFQNLCAVLDFRLTGSDEVTRVEVESKAHVLSGRFTIKGSGTATDRWYAEMLDGGSKKVTLSCTGASGSGVQLGTDTTEFLIAVPENLYDANDLTVKLYSGSSVIKTLTNHAAINTARRSHIYEFRGDARDSSERMRFVLRTAAGQDFMLPFYNQAVPTDLRIDWGDGTKPTTITNGTTLNDALRTHRYQTAATCTLTITPLASESYLANAANPRIPQFGFAVYQGSSIVPLTGSDMLVEVLDPILKSSSTNFNIAFAYTTSLEKVCGGLFSKNPALNQLVNGFEGSGIQELPADLFAGVTASSIRCNSLFYGTKRLLTVPEGIFDPLRGRATTFRSVFNESNLTTIPGGLFKGQSAVTDFGWAFHASKLTNLPSDTFEGCTAVTDYGKTFENCTDLVGPIPAGLFPSTVAELFDRTFNNCTSLVGRIPADLFPSSKVTTFQRTFGNCSRLTGPIPATLFENCTADLKSFAQTFYTCSHLTGPIPEDLFKKATGVTNMMGVFQHCYRLSGEIPTGLFSANTQVERLDSAFFKCFELSGPIPGTLFSSNTKVTNFAYTFATFPSDEGSPVSYPAYPADKAPAESVQEYIRSLGIDPADASAKAAIEAATAMKFSGGIPRTLFEQCPDVTTFKYTFFRNTSLTGGIPKDLFRNKAACTDFERCFYACVGLDGEIEAGLFDGCSAARNFSSTFTSCSLTGSIPTGLFKGTNGDNFYRTFWGNKFTGDIPADLFEGCPGRQFFGVFARCETLGTGPGASGVIPAQLFASCTPATNFAYAFFRCKGLTTIGSSQLFAACSNVTNFGGTFAQSGITSVPDGLFSAAAAKVTTFYHKWSSERLGVFDGCTSLTTVPATIFDANTAASDFRCAFRGCTNLTSSLPELSSNKTLTGFKAFGYAYGANTAIPNLGSLPDDWKLEPTPAQLNQ